MRPEARAVRGRRPRPYPGEGTRGVGFGGYRIRLLRENQALSVENLPELSCLKAALYAEEWQAQGAMCAGAGRLLARLNHIPTNRCCFPNYGFAIFQIINSDALRPNYSQIIIFEKDHFAGICQKRGYITCDKVFAIAKTNYEWVRPFKHIKRLGIIFEKSYKSKVAMHA